MAFIFAALLLVFIVYKIFGGIIRVFVSGDSKVLNWAFVIVGGLLLLAKGTDFLTQYIDRLAALTIMALLVTGLFIGGRKLIQIGESLG